MSHRLISSWKAGLAAIAGMALASNAFAIQSAGTLFVNLDAGHASAGTASWTNTGSLGGSFAEFGNPVLTTLGPNNSAAVSFNGTTDYYRGPSAPAGVTGAGAAGTRSIEVWAFNPSIPGEETLVSLAKRGGPNGSNVAFNYGSDPGFGAVGHWAGADIGWNGAPAAGQWHHLVYTYDGNTTRVYADGLLKNSENVGVLDAHDGVNMLLAAQMEPDGNTVTGGLRGSLSLAKVRVHDGVLNNTQVVANYNEEAASFGAAQLNTNTLAYWRFEQGAPNTNVQKLGPDGTYSPDLIDSSGNGNELAVWTTGGCCGFAYRSSVPKPVVPQTGAPNLLSIKNTGSFPAAFTEPNGPLSGMELNQWTIEASWKPEAGGFRTVVGRDAQGVTGADANLAALYLQALPNNALAIKFVDEAGFFHSAESAPGLIQGFNFGQDPEGVNGTWYNIAATSNGTTLSLYLDSGSGYQLVAQTNLAASGSSNTALTNGLSAFGGVAGGGDWTAGTWTVGRGMYAGGHGDRAYGFIDEVRISGIALNPNQFLFANAAVPEPASMALAMLGAGALAMRRRRAA